MVGSEEWGRNCLRTSYYERQLSREEYTRLVCPSESWEGSGEKIVREMTSILQTYINTRM